MSSVVACQASKTDPGPTVLEDDPTEVSTKARVRFRGAALISSNLAQGLALAENEVCQELGRYDCAKQVHTIALQDIEPYDLGVFSAVPLGISSPIAADRIVLSACTKRARIDLAAPESAVVFKNLLGDGSGITEAIEQLYLRLLQRRPQSSEVEHLKSLYGQLAASGSERPAEDWAALACYAVGTTLEALFY